METYGAPAQVRALVLPVGNIRTSQFQQYYERLQGCNEVRLVDLPKHDGLFNPASAPNGRVRYKFGRTRDHNEALYDLEIWRADLAVFGIAHWSAKDSLQAALRTMREQYSAHSSCQILVFGAPEGAQTGSTHILPVLASNLDSLESALCSATSNLFTSLNALTVSKQLGSFKSPALKALDLPSCSLTPNKTQRRKHLPKGSSVSRNGSISMGVTERAKTRQKGRSIKFLGSLYLLCGNLSQALDTLSEAATTLKAAHDHLWFANALESIGVALVLQAFYELPVTIPTVAITAVDGELEAYNQRSAKLSPSQKLSEFLPGLEHTVMRFYDRCPDTEESVPFLTYQTAILRFAHLLSALRRGGGWNGASMSAVFRGTELPTNVTSSSPSVAQIEEWCSLVSYSGTFTRADLLIQRNLLAVYAYAGLHRKWALAVQSLVLALATQGESSVVKQVPEEWVAGLYGELCGELGGMYNSRMRVLCMRSFMALATRTGQLRFVARVSEEMLRLPELLSNDEQQELYGVVREQWAPQLVERVVVSAPGPSGGGGPGGPGKSTTQLNTTSSTTGGIIYNPFQKELPLSLVQNDPTPAKVVLKNPYAFDIFVAELSILSGDLRVSRPSRDLLLPAKSRTVAIVDLVPPESGTLEVTAVRVQVGRGTVCAVPKLVLSVLPSRPALSLRRTPPPLMLLEGESLPLTLSIANTSTTTSQPLTFAFSDSTIEPLKQALLPGELTRAEIYELEYFLYKRKAIEMRSAATSVEAQNSQEFHFTVHGKRGVSSATILADSGADVSTRIRIPLAVTVYPCIELDGIDIIPTSSGLDLLLNLRNSWRDPLQVTLDSGAAKASATIESLRSQRFVLPLEWSYLSPEELSQPIPQFKQFVVDKSTPEQLAAFWLRERLLERLNGEWTLGDRRGSIDLRGIQLSKRLINVLRIDAATLRMTVTQPQPKLDTPYTLTTEINNNTDHQLSGMLRIVPDRTNRSLISGSLQRPVVVPPGSAVQVETEVVPIAKGEVEWSSIFDLIGGGVAFQRIPLRCTV